MASGRTRSFPPDNGPGLQVMRVLAACSILPAGCRTTSCTCSRFSPDWVSAFNDGLDTVRRLDAQDRYNLTIIEPTFAIDPWYADNPKNPNVRYETFMTREIVPWVEKNLAITGHEQNWLIGFSKSGLGAQDLILKHPDIFTLAASWDFPAGMSSYDRAWRRSGRLLRHRCELPANYRLTAAFVKARSGPFLRQKPHLDRRRQDSLPTCRITRSCWPRWAYVLLEKRRGSCVTTGTVAGFPMPWPRRRTTLNSTAARAKLMRRVT